MALNTDSTDYLTVRRLWSIMSSFKDKIVTALGKKSDKSSTVSNVAWSSSKLTKTINGTTTDVVSASTLKSAMSLNNVTNDAQVKRSEMGTASGVATLDANGIINTSQLPSYVDDVLEYSAKSQFPATGETGKIYVDTSTNITWRWSGTTYVEISPSLALGETSSTAYRGDRGKTAYDHSQVTSGNPHNVTAADVKAVRYDTNAQGLTDTQKSNARTNIGAGTSNLALGTSSTTAAKGDHTHSQYLTASDITGKMNTDASNAVAPSSSGTGATATLLNNLTSTGLDDISSDSVCIPTTYSDGSDTSKWYKRPLSKLWPWIISHPQVNIIKDGVDAYVRVGEDSTKGIALSYDDTGSTPNMGIWVRWASGSGNGKYMCSCDTSGNCTFNGTASGSLNKDASNAITGDGTGTAPTLLGGMKEGTSIVTSGNVYIPTTDSAGTADGKWYKRKLSKIADFITGKGLDGTQITDGLYINGMSYGDRVSINSGYVYGWKIGSMSSNDDHANANFKALVVISDWTVMDDFHCNDFVGVLDIGSRMDSSTISTSNWQLIGRLTSVLPQKTSGANNQRGWAVFCKTNSSTYKSEWYIGKNSSSANMNIGFRYSKITLLPLFEYHWTRELVRETTGNMVFNSGKDDWWGQHLSPTISAATYSLGNAYNPIYINSDKRFQACTSVAKITDIGNAANSHINVRWKDSSVGNDFRHFACFRTAQNSPDGTTPAATLCDIPLDEAKKRILHSTYGTAVGSSSLPVYVDSSGNVTAVGSKMELPAATQAWVRVQQTNGATTYLDSESNKGGVWVSNGGTSAWLCYRDNTGNGYFEGASKYIYDHNNSGFVKLEVGRIGTDANTLYII